VTNGLPALPPHLDVEGARLPANYEAARHALAVCVRLDECRNWAIRAEALASYARQLNDTVMHDMAKRIQARAIRRAGELLHEIPPARGANQNIGDGAVPKVVTRKGAASEAGLSPRQSKTALRVSNVPADEFDKAVEGDDPPTVTELAERGKQANTAHLGDRDPDDYSKGTRLYSLVADFCRKFPDVSVEAGKRGLWPDELAALLKNITIAQAWLERARTILEADDGL
jgi:hypothetical protein